MSVFNLFRQGSVYSPVTSGGCAAPSRDTYFHALRASGEHDLHSESELGEGVLRDKCVLKASGWGGDVLVVWPYREP